MAKSFVIVLVATFIFSQEVLLSTAAPASDPAFQEWLLTFDPSKTPASRSSTCVLKADGFYPDNDPDTCTSKYFVCVGGTQFPQGPCPSPTVWDVTAPGAGSCTELAVATSAACKKSVTVPPIPPPSCTSPGIQEGVFQPTAACSPLYYFCIQGQIYFQNCPTSGHLLDPATQMCGPETDSCKAAVTTPSPTVPPFGCAGKTSKSLNAMGPCTSNYYFCPDQSSPPELKACGLGLVFNYSKPFIVTSATDVPTGACISNTSLSASGCQTTPATMPTILTTMPTILTTKKPYSCPVSSGSFSIPGTTGSTCCMNYYSCSGSIANKVSCPNGYYFEPSKSACISKTSASSSCQQTTITTCTY